MKKWQAIVSASVVWLVAAGVSPGLPTIDVGTHYLQPNTAGQTFYLYVHGTDTVQGLNFNLQVADGGTTLPPPYTGSTNGPSITGVDISTGTIFGGNNTGQMDPGSYPQLAIRTTTTSTGYVAADGLLATVTVDTTGYNYTGEWRIWPLFMSNTVNGATDFAGVPAIITEGKLVIVPEPSTAGLVAVGSMAWLLIRRRSARAGR